MSITVFQIHNVLRTYDHLIKSKSRLATQKHKTAENRPQGIPVPPDPVSISEESRKRLSQYEAFKPEHEE